jgi:hypothetical protein
MADWQDFINKAIESNETTQGKISVLQDELALSEQALGGSVIKGPFGDKLIKWFGEKGARKLDDVIHLFAGINAAGMDYGTGALHAKPHEIMYAYRAAQLQQKKLQEQLRV